MKQWKQNLYVGSLSFAIGIIMFLLPYTGNIESLWTGVILYLSGMFVLGFAVGVLANTYTIQKLEKPQQN
jgi:hypothetical protein